jgi:hypothetical protein
MMHLIFNLLSFWLALDDAWHETKGDPAIHSPDLSLSSAVCVAARTCWCWSCAQINLTNLIFNN